MANKCLIYCRVSSDRQVKEGHGLDSQRVRNRQYIESKGHTVSKSFRDEGVSGAKGDRPGFNALLAYIDDHPNDDFTVVIDDPSRLARDMKVHLALRDSLRQRKVKIESPNFIFDETPEGELVENITAAVNQFGRQQNTRQVKQKMKARAEMGYWPFCYPPGLINKKDPVHGRILVSNEPLASIYKEAIESYDRGVHNTLEEVRQFIEKKYNEHGIGRKTSISGTKAILDKLLYAGYLEYLPWGITRRKAKHTGFIDIETFDRVQEKMKGKAKFAARKDYDLDFPLRPVIICDTCEHPITGAWVHGRTEKYPRYWCKNKQCALYGKSIRRDDIETRFETLLQASKPCDEVIDLTQGVFISAWLDKAKDNVATQNQTKKEMERIGKQISALTEQLAKKLAENDQDLVKIYENQLKKLNKELELLKGVPGKVQYTTDQFRTANDKVFATLKEPVAMWKSDEYKDKLTIFAMYFDEKLRYDMKEGFRTATLALPITLMKQSEKQKNSLVEMAGIEPASGETLIKKI